MALLLIPTVSVRFINGGTDFHSHAGVADPECCRHVMMTVAIIVVVILVVVVVDACKVSSGCLLTIYMKRICTRGVS